MRGRTAGDATDVLSRAMQSDDLIDNIDEYTQDDIDALEDDISSTVTTAETIEQWKRRSEPLNA